MFQFPSNGKADPKKQQEFFAKVWLEFQFPSNGKADPKDWQVRCITRYTARFNSLQTGKRIQSSKYARGVRKRRDVSIPFKRESGSKEISRQRIKLGSITVSIPFKRESGSKGLFLYPTGFPCDCVSIPFKRESVSKVSRISLQTVWTVI